MPDQEAIEVALEDLSDVSAREPSEADNVSEHQENEAGQAAEPENGEQEEQPKETETRSQRRRRLRREREERVNEQVRTLQAENDRLKKAVDSYQSPSREQYNSDADYAAERAVHRVREENAQRDNERIQSDYESVQAEERKVYAEAIQDFRAEGSEKYSDFAELTQKDPDQGGPVITPTMAEAMLESDDGVDVAYYLGKNPKEAAEIAKLPPVAQARRIYALEAKAVQSMQPPKSKAPRPVKPVRGGGASQQKSVSEMSMSEYAAYRQKQLNGEG